MARTHTDSDARGRTHALDWRGDGCELVVVIDTLVERVHFAAGTPPADVGHKALAVNLSDLAAMGAEPEAAVTALCHPDASGAGGRRWLEDFMAGMAALADPFRVALAPPEAIAGPLCVTVEALGRVPAGGALCRRGAAPGDGILVTGTLGDAGLALAEDAPDPASPGGAWIQGRLRRPEPRVAAGLALRGVASAAIDVSDGLAADLGHILAAAGVGARLEAARLPLSRALAGTVATERAWRLALAGGDDYELCATVPPARRAAAEARLAGVPGGHAWIGEITGEPGLTCLDASGRPIAVPGGYAHFSRGPGG